MHMHIVIYRMFLSKYQQIKMIDTVLNCKQHKLNLYKNILNNT